MKRILVALALTPLLLLAGAQVFTEWVGVDVKNAGDAQTMPQGTAISKQSILIQPERQCTISGDFKAPAGSILYFGFRELDTQRKLVLTRAVNNLNGTDTELAVDAPQGSTKVTVKRTVGWDVRPKTDFMAFETEPDFSDLPNTNVIAVAGIEGNDITLKSATPKAYPAGTKVRMHRDRAPFNYKGAENAKLTGEWQHFSGIVTKRQKAGTRDTMWRPGTSYAEVVIGYRAPNGSTGELSFKNITVEISGDKLVGDGVANSSALFEPSGWKKDGAWLKNLRDGLDLNAEALYSTAQFDVTIDAVLDKVGGTGFGIATGNITWTLDDADGNIIVQGRDFRPVLLGKSASFIKAGKPFALKIVGRDTDRKMRTYIDGKLVGETTYLVNRTLGFGIRTGNARLGIRNFEISGEATHVDAAAPISPILAKRNENCAMRLPRWNGGKGTFKAIFGGEALQLAIDENGQTVLPAAVLDKAYSAAKCEYRVHSATLEVALPNAKYICRIAIDDASVKSDLPVGKIVKTPVGNRISVNGNVWNFYLSHWDYNARQVMERAYSPDEVKRYADAGFKGSLLILAPYKYMGAKEFDYAGFMQEFDDVAGKIIAENPAAMFEIQFFLFTSSEWNEIHQDELIQLDNGIKKLAHAYRQELMPSYASPSWRKEMGEIVAQCIRRMRKSPYGDRVGTFRLLYANCGEWNHWGYHEQAYVDYSKPMQRAFGEWLKKKYETEAALQKAWARNDVSFTSDNLVPSRENRLAGGLVFRGEGAKTQPSVDYYAFFQECAVETIEHFAKLAKEASDNRLIVGSYYGYYHGHYYANPYHYQDSGNYATWKMLQSPYIDFFGGACPYNRRDIMLQPNGITSSIELHGKVWICEGDTRSHRSVAKPTPHQGITEMTQSETVAIMLRDYMAMTARQTTTYLYDFIAGWYRDEPTMNIIKRIYEFDNARLKMSGAKPTVAEVAMIYSEDCIPYTASQHGAAMGGEKFGPSSMDYWGVPVDSFLVTDLEKIDFSQYKVVIFVNSFLYTEKLKKIIDTKVARDKRTMIFFSTPGVVGEDNIIHPENCEKITGIKLKLEEPTAGKPLTSLWKKNLCSLHYTRYAHIQPEGVRALATFNDGAIAIAERTMNGCRRIVSCHPFPDALMMRDLLAREKVHIYTSGKSGLPAAYFAPPYIGVFSRTGGAQTITLKEPVEIAVDMLTGKVLCEKSNKIDFTMERKAQTMMIFAGTKEDLLKLAH